MSSWNDFSAVIQKHSPQTVMIVRCVEIPLFVLERLWCLSGLIKKSYKPADRPLEALVFDWEKDLPQAGSDSRPSGYTTSVTLRLLKWPKLRMTCLQRTMCAAEHTQAVFPHIWAGISGSLRSDYQNVYLTTCSMKTLQYIYRENMTTVYDALLLSSWAAHWHIPLQGMPVYKLIQKQMLSKTPQINTLAAIRGKEMKRPEEGFTISRFLV